MRKLEGIRSVQIVAFGRGVDQQQLESIVYAPTDIISLKNFDDLENQQKTIITDLTNSICPTDACPGFDTQGPDCDKLFTI